MTDQSLSVLNETDDSVEQRSHHPQAGSIAMTLRPISITQKVNQFFTDLTNLSSLLSIAVLFMSAAFISIGHFLLYQLHSQSVPFLFFLSPVVIMVLYAIGYGTYASSKHAFNGGLVSARYVMRMIYYMSSISFAAAGVQMMQASWNVPSHQFAPLDPNLSILCLWMGPILMAAFAFIYGVYANVCDNDLVSSGRTGNARRAMSLMTFLTLCVFLYNIALATGSLDVASIWLSLASFAGAFAVCFGAMFIFTIAVKLSVDQGVKPS